MSTSSSSSTKRESKSVKLGNIKNKKIQSTLNFVADILEHGGVPQHQVPSLIDSKLLFRTITLANRALYSRRIVSHPTETEADSQGIQNIRVTKSNAVSIHPQHNFITRKGRILTATVSKSTKMNGPISVPPFGKPVNQWLDDPSRGTSKWSNIQVENTLHDASSGKILQQKLNDAFTRAVNSQMESMLNIPYSNVPKVFQIKDLNKTTSSNKEIPQFRNKPITPQKPPLPKKLDFASVVPLHHIWNSYAEKTLRNILSKPSPVRLATSRHSKLLSIIRLDYHGAILKVIASKKPDQIGKTGIVVYETRHAFGLCTPQNRVLCILKKECTFSLCVKGYIFTRWGPSLVAAPAERSRRKFAVLRKP